MAQRYHHVLAGALLACLALPVSAEVVLTTETMTGTGLPPGQTLPSTQPKTATPTPFTPKTVSAEKMLAWGPATAATDTSTKPTIQRLVPMRPLTREAPMIVKSKRKLP